MHTDVVVKVSAAPHLLQLDLAGEVNSAATTATMADHTLTFTLQKVHCALLAFGHTDKRLQGLGDTTTAHAAVVAPTECNSARCSTGKEVDGGEG